MPDILVVFSTLESFKTGIKMAEKKKELGFLILNTHSFKCLVLCRRIFRSSTILSQLRDKLYFMEGKRVKNPDM